MLDDADVDCDSEQGSSNPFELQIMDEEQKCTTEVRLRKWTAEVLWKTGII